MNMKNLSVRRLVRCAVIAAVYVVVCLVLAPFSYGAVQVRVAEALCLLPVFGAEYIVGVTLGCFLANLLGSTVVDVVFGTLASGNLPQGKSHVHLTATGCLQGEGGHIVVLMLSDKLFGSHGSSWLLERHHQSGPHIKGL